MKNIKFLFALSILVTMFACEKDYEPLNDYSDVDWYTSGFRKEKVVGLEKYMSFSDLSHNTTSHSWSFADGSGCKFLKGNITRQDSTYYPFVDESLDTISNAATIHVLFTEPGIKNIRLRNTFSEYVSFKGADTLEAVLENGEWVIDTVFVVDVYDSIQSAFKVFKDEAEIANVNYDQQVFLSDSSSWPIQEVMAGEQLKFVDMTTVGRPTDGTWNVGGGTPSVATDSASVVNFYRLGDYYARFTSQRTGENVPGGYKMKYVPLKIRVVQSNLPFEVTGPVVELENEIIQISLTGEMVPFSGEEGNFTVHVTNPNGFDQAIPVKTASINSTQKNIIDLELDGPIYNTDVISVSWAGGNIESLDERALVEFTDLPVVMDIVELCGDKNVYGFETGDITSTGWVPQWDNKGVLSVSNEMAYEGTYSLKMEADGGWAIANGPADLNMVDGKTYTWSYKAYIPSSNAAYDHSFSWLLPWGGQIGWWHQVGDRDGWTTMSKTFTYSGGPVERYVAYRLADNGGSVILYMDDISVVEVENRP